MTIFNLFKKNKSNIENSKKDAKGFTLIEVIISLGLLAILAAASSQSIQSSLRSKKQIQYKIDLQSIVRDGLEVMKRDISKAFNYYDFHAELYNETQKERIERCETNAKKTKTTTPTTPTTPSTKGVDPAVAKALEICDKIKGSSG